RIPPLLREHLSPPCVVRRLLLAPRRARCRRRSLARSPPGRPLPRGWPRRRLAARPRPLAVAAPPAPPPTPPRPPPCDPRAGPQRDAGRTISQCASTTKSSAQHLFQQAH